MFNILPYVQLLTSRSFNLFLDFRRGELILLSICISIEAYCLDRSVKKVKRLKDASYRVLWISIDFRPNKADFIDTTLVLSSEAVAEPSTGEMPDQSPLEMRDSGLFDWYFPFLRSIAEGDING